MSKNYKQIATNILQLIGNSENVSHLEHCSTRLRFTINDTNKVDREGLKKCQGVMGVVGSGNQCQVVIGNDVIEVYDEIVKMVDIKSDSAKNNNAGKQNIGAAILDFVVGVFQPLIPAIAGGGILKAFLSLFVLLGIIDSSNPLYTVLYTTADAALYFLPVMVAVTMSTKLNINRLVAITCVGSLIIPSMTAAIGNGLNIFSVSVQNIAYAYQVFPAILSVGFLYIIEKLVTKFTPKPIRVFFVPMICFILVVPVTLLILGPLGYNIGQLITSVILFLYDKLGWIAVALLASILPLMIATGMHKALVPYAVSSITEMGEELLYMPASLAHNISESGACFAVALKSKDSNMKSTALSAGISALFGITEPALYGVTLLHKKALIGVMIGSFVGGLTVGLTAVKAFVAMGPGLAGMAMFVDSANSMNIVWAFAGFGVSLVVSFIATLFLYKDEVNEEVNNETSVTSDVNASEIYAPVDGKCFALNTIDDEVFGSGIMGEGLAFEFDGDTIYAPCDGEVMMVATTKHAIGIKDSIGAEILIHVGMDTVKLDGEGFTVLKKSGEKVKLGEELIKIDRKFMKDNNINLTTPMVITNSKDFKIDLFLENKTVSKAETIVAVYSK